MSKISKSGPSTILDKTPASVLVILALISYQFGAAIAIRLFDIVGPGGTVLLRVGFSALFLTILLIAQRGVPKHIKRSTLFWTILYGLALAGMNFFIYSSFARIPLGVAVTIEFLGPLAVALMGSRKPTDFLFVVMAAAGIALFAPWTAAHLDPLGVIFALIAAACWAFYILLAAKVGKLLPGRSGLTLGMIFGAIAMLPIGISGAGTALLSPLVIGAGLVVAFLSSTLPYAFEMEALRRMPTRVFGILVSLEPAVATIAGVLLLHQGLAARSVCALLLVTAAAIGVTLEKRQKTEPAVIN